MMSTTHAAMGASLAVPVACVAPELAVVVALAAVLGGVFPDLDVVGEHRKALHFPVYYWALALPAAAAALAWPGPLTAALAAFLVAAALHSAVDVLGGGLGLRPWEDDDDRGVYVHPLRRWLRPRRVVRYDGAPEDLLAYALFAAPVGLLLADPVPALAAGGFLASAGYVLVRKRIPDVTPERFR
ncbi:MAG: metal-dependent hydrolase [Halobacteriaceae archaeon]